MKPSTVPWGPSRPLFVLVFIVFALAKRFSL